MELEYDEYGRLTTRTAENAIDPDLVKRYFYDDSGWVEATQIGNTGLQGVAFGEVDRVVYRHDGVEGQRNMQRILGTQ